MVMLSGIGTTYCMTIRRSLATHYVADCSSPTHWKLGRLKRHAWDELVSLDEHLDCSVELLATRQEDFVDITCMNIMDAVADVNLISVLSRIMAQGIEGDKFRFPGNETATPSTLFETSDEIVSMVDQDGEALGAVPRHLVHKYNILHSGIGVLIHKGGALYVHRRAPSKRIFPNLYDMWVGGVRLAAEADGRLTALREIKEELGLQRPDALSEKLDTTICCTKCNRCVVDIFSYAANDDDTIAWQPEEVAWGEWVSLEAVEYSAEKSMQRFVNQQEWPGFHSPTILGLNSTKLQDSWDYVPDGLVVWDSWLRNRHKHSW